MCRIISVKFAQCVPLNRLKRAYVYRSIIHRVYKSSTMYISTLKAHFISRKPIYRSPSDGRERRLGGRLPSRKPTEDSLQKRERKRDTLLWMACRSWRGLLRCTRSVTNYQICAVCIQTSAHFNINVANLRNFARDTRVAQRYCSVGTLYVHARMIALWSASRRTLVNVFFFFFFVLTYLFFYYGLFSLL